MSALPKPDELARKVVITGVGMLTPCGNDRETTWQALVEGRSGIDQVGKFDVSPFPSQVAGEIRGFDPLTVVPRREVSTLDNFEIYALAAASEAVEDAGLQVEAENPERVGVSFGVGLGGISSMERYQQVLLERGPRRISPFLVPMMIPNMAASHVSLRFGARGPCEVVTTACASGAHALGAALNWIRRGIVDIVIAGGAEAAVTPLGLGAFCAMRALSTRFNREPQRASRPFDLQRDGFVLAEGAAAVVLESAESARRRGARTYAELAGFGSTADAHHITQPDPEGLGQARCLELALADAGASADGIDYINTHGTSTKQNDVAEASAIRAVLGADRAREVMASSTKSMTGHLLGAAGALEACICALAVDRGVAPPTINLESPDPQCELGHVSPDARNAAIELALTSSFGFGGTNAVLVLRRWPRASEGV